MEWLIVLPLLLVWFEFSRLGKHVNGLKDDCRGLKDELKVLRERVDQLEKDNSVLDEEIFKLKDPEMYAALKRDDPYELYELEKRRSKLE